MKEDEPVPVEVFLDFMMAYVDTTSSFLLATYNLIQKQEEARRIVIPPPGTKVQ